MEYFIDIDISDYVIND